MKKGFSYLISPKKCAGKRLGGPMQNFNFYEFLSESWLRNSQSIYFLGICYVVCPKHATEMHANEIPTHVINP